MEVRTEPCKAVLRVDIPLHKPYPYSLYHGEDSSILGTNEMFGFKMFLPPGVHQFASENMKKYRVLKGKARLPTNHPFLRGYVC